MEAVQGTGPVLQHAPTRQHRRLLASVAPRPGLGPDAVYPSGALPSLLRVRQRRHAGLVVVPNLPDRPDYIRLDGMRTDRRLRRVHARRRREVRRSHVDGPTRVHHYLGLDDPLRNHVDLACVRHVQHRQRDIHSGRVSGSDKVARVGHESERVVVEAMAPAHACEYLLDQVAVIRLDEP